MPEVKISKNDTTLYLSNISKTFGGTMALKGVDLVIRPGEIHGLLGQNGCGKSTLIKVLAGFHEPDKGGKLWVNGERVRLPLSPGEFAEYGMSFVHQNLGLIPSLTVLENWNIAEIALGGKINFNWSKERHSAQETFKKYGIDIDANMLVEKMSAVQKAMLAILRAVEDIRRNKIASSKKRGLLVLDEPTVFLPRTEVDVLFNLVRTVAKEGISVLFVSHDIDEVMELTDSFTVLRDGLNVGGDKTENVTKADIIECILGKKLDEYHVEEKNRNCFEDGGQVIEIRDLSGDIVEHQDFKIYKGEVLGITGLVGSGFEEVPYLLFGANERKSGCMVLNRKEIDIQKFSPTKAVRAQMALIPADRADFGGISDLSVQDNLLMQVLHLFRPARLQKKQMSGKAKQLVDEYEVHPKDETLGFGQLSGGNQQKVLLAKWIQTNPEMLILHEPTQGVDVGARQQVYRLIEKTVKEFGTSVICSSSDYEQLEQICDRVLIFVKGRIVKELVGKEISKEAITKLCYETAAAG